MAYLRLSQSINHFLVEKKMAYNVKTPKIINVFNKKLSKLVESAKLSGCIDIINELIFCSKYTNATKKEFFYTIIRHLKSDKDTEFLALELSQLFKEKLKELS